MYRVFGVLGFLVVLVFVGVVVVVVVVVEVVLMLALLVAFVRVGQAFAFSFAVVFFHCFLFFAASISSSHELTFGASMKKSPVDGWL